MALYFDIRLDTFEFKFNYFKNPKDSVESGNSFENHNKQEVEIAMTPFTSITNITQRNLLSYSVFFTLSDIYTGDNGIELGITPGTFLYLRSNGDSIVIKVTKVITGSPNVEVQGTVLSLDGSVLNFTTTDTINAYLIYKKIN